MAKEDRLAVIIGAGSGIGRGAAIALANVGYGIVAADIDLAAAEETLRLTGIEGHAFAVDARDRDSVERLAVAAEAVGPVDLWINSAGVGAMCSIIDIAPDHYERVRRINMDGTLWGCAAAARHMIPRGRGSIINISSNAADQPVPGLAVYAMTKAAVNMLTRSLAMELGTHGIRVNGIAPGFILTAMTAPESLTQEARDALIECHASRSPLNKVGTPEDIAAAILYFASDAACFVTGQTLRVNGGCTMP